MRWLASEHHPVKVSGALALVAASPAPRRLSIPKINGAASVRVTAVAALRRRTRLLAVAVTRIRNGQKRDCRRREGPPRPGLLACLRDAAVDRLRPGPMGAIQPDGNVLPPCRMSVYRAAALGRTSACDVSGSC